MIGLKLILLEDQLLIQVNPRRRQPRLADLIDGKYAEVVPLQSGDVELVVFDAATGKRLWAKSIATKESYTDSFAGHAFLMSPTRVYAAVGTFASKLRVFDLASGREVGSIGEL